MSAPSNARTLPYWVACKQEGCRDQFTVYIRAQPNRRRAGEWLGRVQRSSAVRIDTETGVATCRCGGELWYLDMDRRIRLVA